MKKHILITLLLITNFINAQKLEVTPNGLKNADDNTKTFVVIEIENKTASELYNNSLKYLNKAYKNPDEVIKGNIKDEYLKFVTYAPKFISIKNSFDRTPFNAKYTVELNFKDGRVKYEIIELDIKNDANINLNFTGGGLSFFIYNKKGELKRENEKKDIENYFNLNINNLILSLKDIKSSDDNW